ncbi:MAG: DUF6884 domain-containing protein [Thermoplasmata archaeon]
MSKYEPLGEYLRDLDKDRVLLSFEEIEDILGADLPKSARKHSAWWSNGGHSQADAWMDAGWRVEDLNQNDEEVVFRKVGTPKKKIRSTTTKKRTHRSKTKTRSNYKPKKEEGTIGLISCTKSKKDHPSKPKELYMPSHLFKKARKYCEKYHDDYYILSAKHHLLDPNGLKIEPYDETLNDATVSERREWSKKVFEQLKEKNLLSKKLIIHAGKKYYEFLLPLLEDADVEYEIPTEGLAIGQSMSWYNQWIEE